MQTKNKVKLGNVIVEKSEDGKTRSYITLGTKSTKNSKYNLTVEILVKDADGNVVARQQDGFIQVVDPRKQPDELLAANKISPEIADKMRQSAQNIPAKITRELWVNKPHANK